MRVLIDTNILLDVLMGRQPYFDVSDKILKLCVDKRIEGYMAAHSIPNMYYVLRRTMPEEDRREVLLDICCILKVEKIDSIKLLSALQNRNFTDMEDCLQEECAVAVAADYIVTRNIKDFETSRIPAIMPDEFLRKFNKLLSSL